MFEEDLGIEAERAEKGEFKKGLFLVVGEAYMTVFQRLAHKNTRSLCGCFHFV